MIIINNALAKDRGRVLFGMIIYRYRLIQLRTGEREREGEGVAGNRQLWVIVVWLLVYTFHRTRVPSGPCWTRESGQLGLPHTGTSHVFFFCRLISTKLIFIRD